MTKFNDEIKSAKEILKSLIKEDSSNELIEALTQVDMKLDNAVNEHKAVENEVQSTKDKLVEMVKSTSFKIQEPQSDIGELQQEKSLDEIMADELNKLAK